MFLSQLSQNVSGSLRLLLVPARAWSVPSSTGSFLVWFLSSFSVFCVIHFISFLLFCLFLYFSIFFVFNICSFLFVWFSSFFICRFCFCFVFSTLVQHSALNLLIWNNGKFRGVYLFLFSFLFFAADWRGKSRFSTAEKDGLETGTGSRSEGRWNHGAGSTEVTGGNPGVRKVCGR